MKLKHFSFLLPLILSTTLLSTSCSTSKTAILRNELANDKLCILFSNEDLYNLMDGKENAIIAITNSSSASKKFITNIREFIKENEAIVYEINLATYVSHDKTFNLPEIYDSNCPALLILQNGKVRTYQTYSESNKTLTTKKSLTNYLNKYVKVLDIYNFANINYVDEYQYYFYKDTDSRLKSYVFGQGQSGLNYPFVVVFYDSTQEKERNFIYNDLLTIKNNYIKTYTINVTYDKYNYSSYDHSFKFKESYLNYSSFYQFGNYAERNNGIVVTPAINVYYQSKLQNCLIYGSENYTDTTNTFEVIKSTKTIKSILNSLDF